MSGFVFADDQELARCSYAHPDDSHLAIILVFIRKGVGGEFVVWDDNTNYKGGGRFRGAYFPVRRYLEPGEDGTDELVLAEAAQRAKLDAYKEFHRRVSNMLARSGADVKRVD